MSSNNVTINSIEKMTSEKKLNGSSQIEINNLNSFQDNQKQSEEKEGEIENEKEKEETCDEIDTEEIERLQRLANEETTKSEDLANLRQFLQDMRVNQNFQTRPGGNATGEGQTGGGQRFFIGAAPQDHVDSYPQMEAAGDNQYYTELHTRAPDGGWAWLVVFGSFIFMSLVDGICFTYGLLVPELSRYFDLQHLMSLAMLPGSLITGMYILTGPLANLLANSFDYRRVALLGAIFATVAIFGSAFVQNFGAFTALFGVIGGIGFGLIYLPAIAIVGIWFQRRRALAVGLALCGSGMGTLLFGETTPLAMLDVSFSHLMIIWAAVSAQCIVAVVLFRPLDVHQRILLDDERKRLKHIEKRNLARIEREEKEKKKMAQKHKRTRVTIQRGSIMQRIIEEKKRQRTTSVGSLDGKVITQDNEVIESGPDQYTNPMISQNAINRIAENLFRRLSRQRSQDLSRDSLAMTKEGMTQLVHGYVSQISLQGPSNNNYPLIGGSKSVTENNSQVGLNLQGQITANGVSVGGAGGGGGSGEISENSLNSQTQQGNFEIDDNIENELEREFIKELSRPVYRKDIHYTGSFTYVSGNGMVQNSLQTQGSFNRSQLSLQNAMNGAGGGGGQMINNNIGVGGQDINSNNNLMKTFLKEMFDFNLLKSPTFLLLIFASVCSMLGFFVPFHYFPLYLSEPLGLREAGHIISVMGLCNTIGRLLATAYIERNVSGRYEYLDCLWIHNGALLTAATAAFVVTLFPGYLSAYLVLGGIYSLSMAAFISLKSILVVELFGIQRLTNAFSFLLLFQGISVIVSTPLATFLYQLSQNKAAPFYFASACVAVSALAHMPLRIVADWERHRLERYFASRQQQQQPMGSHSQALEEYEMMMAATGGAGATPMEEPHAISLQQGRLFDANMSVDDHSANVPFLPVGSDVIIEEEDEIESEDQIHSSLLLNGNQENSVKA